MLGNKVFEKEIFYSESIELEKGILSEGVYWVILRGDKTLIRKAIVLE